MTNEEIERRRKMFHWFIDGLGDVGHLTPDGKVVYATLHGLKWHDYKYLTPDLITKYYNVIL